MGNTKSLLKNTAIVINNTCQDITIKKGNDSYSKELKETVYYSFDEEETIGPGKHVCFSLSELTKYGKASMNIDPKIEVSFKGKTSNQRVALSGKEFEKNAGIILKMGENNQLVKELVSREEAKMGKQIKRSGKHEEELKQHLLSVVEKRNAASASQPSKEKVE